MPVSKTIINCGRAIKALGKAFEAAPDEEVADLIMKASTEVYLALQMLVQNQIGSPPVIPPLPEDDE